MKHIPPFCLLPFAFCLLSSCTEEPPPTLNFKEREIVDSLFKMHADTMRPVFDNLCNARYDSAVLHNVDSMMEVRRGEIQKYLEKVRREIQQ